MLGDSGEQATVRPLTKTRSDGDPYKRRDEVEQQLHEVIRLSPDELERRIRIPKSEVQGYLFDETLVYLLKEAHRREDLTMENLIYDHLAIRVEILLRKHAYQVDSDDLHDFMQEVHTRLLEKIFDLSSDRADYAEVMFGDFVTSEAATLKRKHWRLDKKERGNLEIDAPKEDGHDYDPADERPISPEEIAILNDALGKLPEKTVTAFLLHYRDGLQIESRDPDKLTVAKIMGVSGRAIRIWFRQAVTLLTEDEGGDDET